MARKSKPAPKFVPGRSPLKTPTKKTGANKAKKASGMRSAPKGTPLQPNC